MAAAILIPIPADFPLPLPAVKDTVYLFFNKNYIIKIFCI